MDKLFADGKKFKNKNGGEVILYGINFVNKGEFKTECDKLRGKRDYMKPQPDEKLILKFKAAGFNCIRLGLIWEAIEPAPGKYNEEYLDRMVEVGRLCEKHGMYFFLDMHQDLYGSGSIIGDGAPSWACLTNGHEFSKQLFVWAEGYFFGKATNNAFRAFWDNEKVLDKGLQDYYADMWAHVVKRFKDNTALVGYDIMNEPFPGKTERDIFTTIVESAVKKAESLSGKTNNEPMNLIDCFKNTSERIGFIKLILKTANRIKNPKKLKAVKQVLTDAEMFRKVVCTVEDDIKKFDTEYYTPFLNKISNKIREIDGESIIFMENSYWSNLGIPYSAEKPVINGETDSQVAFAPHGYDLLVDTPLYKYADNGRVTKIFEEHKISQERLGVPVLVGEYGAFPDKDIAIDCADFLLSVFDENKWSSTYWAYYDKFLKTKVMKSLVRPHPQEVYGEILNYKYDKQNNIFYLNFESSEGSAPSTVYLPVRPKKIKTPCRTDIQKFGDCCILKLYPVDGVNEVEVEL